MLWARASETSKGTIAGFGFGAGGVSGLQGSAFRLISTAAADPSARRLVHPASPKLARDGRHHLGSRDAGQLSLRPLPLEDALELAGRRIRNQGFASRPVQITRT